MWSSPTATVLWITVWISGFVTGFYPEIGKVAAAAGSDSNGSSGNSGRRRLRVITMQVEPYVRLKWEPGVLGNDRYEGYYVDLMQALANEMDSTYQLQLVADAKIGKRGDLGNWNGLLGEIMRGRADMALAPIAVTQERLQIAKFTQPLGDVQLAIVVRQDSQATNSGGGVQGPLQYGVIAGSNAEMLLKHSDQSDRTLSDEVQRRPRAILGSINEGLERVRRENFAMIIEESIAEYYIRQPPCDLAIAGSFMGDSHYALAVRNDSGLLQDINRALHTLTGNDDIWRALQRRWWRSLCSSVPHLFADQNGNSKPPSEGSLQLTETQSPSIDYLAVVTLEEEPYFTSSRSSATRHHGYVVDLMNEMSRRVPFRYRWVLERRLGKEKNGNWNGLIGRLVDGTADLGAVPFTASRKLGQELSFTEPFMHSTLSILIKSPTFNEGDDMPFYFMEHLLNQTDWEFGVVKKSRVEKLLRKSKDKLYQDIWTKIRAFTTARNSRNQDGNIVPSFEEGLRRVRSGDKFALIVENVEAALVTSRQPCDLLTLDQYRSMIGYSFAVKADNPLVHKINQALVELKEENVLQTLFLKWWYKDNCRSMTEDPRIFDINFTQKQTSRVTSTIPPTTTPTTTTTTTTTPPPTTTTIATTTLEEITTQSTTTTRRNRRRNRKRKKHRKHHRSGLTTESPSGTTVSHTTQSPTSEQETSYNYDDTSEDSTVPRNVSPPSEGTTDYGTTARTMFSVKEDIDEWVFPDSDVDSTYRSAFEDELMTNDTEVIVYNPDEKNFEWYYQTIRPAEEGDDEEDDEDGDDEEIEEEVEGLEEEKETDRDFLEADDVTGFTRHFGIGTERTDDLEEQPSSAASSNHFFFQTICFISLLSSIYVFIISKWRHSLVLNSR